MADLKPNAVPEASAAGKVLVLGTGGTIAGTSSTGRDADYRAAQIAVADLVAAVPALATVPLECQQVAQVDSKDMGWPVWRSLLGAVAEALARPDVDALVVTHGTDALEETALLLHCCLPHAKPVVLTAAMRPATSTEADGPANLLAAVAVARWAAMQAQPAVVAVLAGRVWAAAQVRKAHSWQIDAFDGGGAEPLAMVPTSSLQAWPQVQCHQSQWPQPLGWAGLDLAKQGAPNGPPTWPLALPATLPCVALMTSHADTQSDMLHAWCEAALALQPPLRGLVLACSGNGSVHEAWLPVLQRLADAGVVIWRSSRVAQGGVHDVGQHLPWPGVRDMTAVQARVVLSLALWCRPQVLGQPEQFALV